MSGIEPIGIFESISIIYTSLIENLISIEHPLPLITKPNPSPSPISSFKLLLKSCPVIFISISSLNFCKAWWQLLFLHTITFHRAANHLFKHKVDDSPLLLKHIVLWIKSKHFIVCQTVGDVAPAYLTLSPISFAHTILKDILNRISLCFLKNPASALPLRLYTCFPLCLQTSFPHSQMY